MKSELDRFNTNHPDLCPALRWKGQFILAEPDPRFRASNEGLVLVSAHADLHWSRRQDCRTRKLLFRPSQVSWHWPVRLTD